MKDFFEITLNDLLNMSADILTNGLDRESLNLLSKHNIELITEELLITIYTATQYHIFKRDIKKAINDNLIESRTYDIKTENDDDYFSSIESLEKVIIDLQPIRIFAGPVASHFLECSKNFKTSNTKPTGIYVSGTISNCKIFKAPNKCIPNNIIYVETNKKIYEFILIDFCHPKTFFDSNEQDRHQL